MPTLFTQPVGFSVDYYDPVASLLKSFVLIYHPDGKVQMVDSKTGKTFLAKTYAKSVSARDLYIGGTVVVFSRELSIMDYADESTRKHVGARQARAFVMILPSAMSSLGEIVAAVQNGGENGDIECEDLAVLANVRMCRVGANRLKPTVSPVPPDLDNAISQTQQEGSAVALDVIVSSRRGGYKALLEVVDRLKLTRGKDGVFMSSNPSQSKEHIRYVFTEGALETVGVGGLDGEEKACTLCLVKPHVVRDGGLGAVLSLVSEHGFRVTAMQSMYLGELGAEELLRPYRGVVPYHGDAVRHLKSGACVALQIEGGEKVVEDFREACGPADPEVARALYPNTIRAILGVQQATNAVHCTDLPEDGMLECQYVFEVLGKGRQGT